MELDTTAPKELTPGAGKYQSEKALLKQNEQQGAFLGAVSRTGNTVRHSENIEEDRYTPDPPLHSTKISQETLG